MSKPEPGRGSFEGGCGTRGLERFGACELIAVDLAVVAVEPKNVSCRKRDRGRVGAGIVCVAARCAVLPRVVTTPACELGASATGALGVLADARAARGCMSWPALETRLTVGFATSVAVRRTGADADATTWVAVSTSGRAAEVTSFTADFTVLVVAEAVCVTELVATEAVCVTVLVTAETVCLAVSVTVETEGVGNAGAGAGAEGVGVAADVTGAAA